MRESRISFELEGITLSSIKKNGKKSPLSWIHGGAALAVVLLCALSTTPAWARRHHKFKGVIIVNQIIKLDGTMTDNGVQAPEFSGVKQGDVLETGDRSYADIRIPGLGIFRLGPNTKFRLTSFSDRNESRFEVQKGTVLSLFRRPGHHIMQLNHATLTLHGTTFFVETDPASDSDKICLCDGKVTAQIKDIDTKTAKVRRPSADPTATAAAPSPVNPEASANPSAALTATPAATPVPTAAPSPTATPRPRELDVVSNNEHVQFEVSADGISVKDLKLLDLHSNKEIQDLESLYDLP